MLLRTPVGEMSVTSLLRGKFLMTVSCSCLAVNNFAILANNIQKQLSVYMPKLCIAISVFSWRCLLGYNQNFYGYVSLIQWQWPVCQQTGLFALEIIYKH